MFVFPKLHYLSFLIRCCISLLLFGVTVYLAASCEARALLEVEIMYLYALSFWGSIKSYSGAYVVHQVVRDQCWATCPIHACQVTITWQFSHCFHPCVSNNMLPLSFDLCLVSSLPPPRVFFLHYSICFLMLPGKNFPLPFLFNLLDCKCCWKEMWRGKCILE